MNKKTALILHGIDGHAGIHWQKWLSEQLAKKNYQIIMPNLPDSNHPQRNVWLSVVKNAVKNTDMSKLVIIAHSLGVATALDLAEEKNNIFGLVSAAGFHKDYGAKLNSYFMTAKSINMQKVKNTIKNKAVIFGSDDPYVPQFVLQSLADELNTKPTIIDKGGHLNTESGYTRFPLLTKIIGGFK